MIRVKWLFLVAMFVFFSNAYAEGQTVLPICKNISKFTLDDYIDGLNMVKEVAPDPIFISLWGWEKLEADEGESNITSEMIGIKYAIKQGFEPYVGVTVIDTVKRVLPNDLKDKGWDDPVMLQRYNEVLKQISRETSRDLKYFVIANEADVYFGKHTDEFQAFLVFVERAKKIVYHYFPKAVVGVSVTFEGLNAGDKRSDIVRRIVDISDSAFFTYYPQTNMVFTPPHLTPPNLDAMIEVARKKNVILQEVGYPSAGQGINEETQAQFFEIIIPEIESRPQIKLASIFALHDFDEEFCSNFFKYYEVGGLFLLTDTGKNFQNFLCHLGLRDSNGNPKPAWFATVEAYKKIKEKSK